jgi:hypothetical protein
MEGAQVRQFEAADLAQGPSRAGRETGQIRAALMTHQDVDDASALPGLLAQIPADESIDTTGGDGAYDSKHCHKGNRRARRYAIDSAARGRETLV